MIEPMKLTDDVERVRKSEKRSFETKKQRSIKESVLIRPIMDNIISIAKFYIPHCLTTLMLDIHNLVHTEIHIGEYNTWHNRSDGF